MKVKPNRPLEHRGAIMTSPFDTNEQHGRELIRSGRATLVDDASETGDKTPPKRVSRKSKSKDDSE